MDPALTYTLADLEKWPRKDPEVSLAVLGHPIKHSISPAMHNAALAEMAREDATYSDWRYFRFEVPPDELPRALDLLHAKKFRGVNLTVPHKILAVSRIAEIDPAARPVGAVNTLLWRADGWKGFNTDGHGLLQALRKGFGVEMAGGEMGYDVILLGAGGAARGAAVACLQRGVRSLWIANRTRENLDALLAHLAPLAGEVPVRGFDPADTANTELPAGAVVINATSAGLKQTDPLPIDLAALPTPSVVYDMIYNPAETPLLEEARRRSIPADNGLWMLIHQGARALNIWVGDGVPENAKIVAPVGVMAAAARAAMGR